MILYVWLLFRVSLLAKFHVEMYRSRVFPFVVEEECMLYISWSVV